MRGALAVVLFLFTCPGVLAQGNGFVFGKITYADVEMNSFPADTSAEAVVLREFGEAYMADDYDLIYERHVVVKILKQSGVERGDIQLNLDKHGLSEETVRSFEASTFNMEGGKIVESKMQTKVFKQEASEYRIVQRFALPNVKVGSVIEYQYTIESPWISNFVPWQFQSDIPKVSSEYWATIPPYYVYNITLRGFLKLSKEKSEIVKDAFSGGMASVDCTRIKFGMNDIPAFVEEKYMTAASNYISAVNFELLEIRRPDGRVDKITTEWKDAVEELRKEERFGLQLKRAKNLVGDDVAAVTAGVNDPLAKAKLVYNYITGSFEWNGYYGKYSEHGIRKALDQRKGNVGDINLTLVAALLAADLNAEPVILSTRENGFPVELHPVITDFNYVIARVTIDDKVYLLDATDDFMPFGLVPERCINGKGRVIVENSTWQRLDAPANSKSVALMNLKILPDGRMTGHLETNYYSYAAVDERKELAVAQDDKAYIAKKTAGTTLVNVTNIEKQNADDFEKPLTIKFDFEADLFDPAAGPTVLLNPFLIDAWERNPFKSTERLFPVDFGIPIDERAIVYVELPEGYQIKSLPENVGLALPNAGGRYIYQAKIEGNKISISSNLLIARTYYSAEEYHYLKELFARVLQTQGADMVIERN